jgi:hypothetical protein
MEFIFIIIVLALTLGLVDNMKNRIKLLWFRLLGKNHNQNNEHEIQFGEFCTTGKGKLDVDLLCPPKRIKVEFKDSPNQVPCNPHHDRLSWDIVKTPGKLILVIKWNVSDIREIKWMVFY